MSASGRERFGIPETLVLYRTSDGWRYASYSRSGVLDGRLGNLRADSPAETAQEALRLRMEEAVQQRLDVVWSPAEQPDWWTGAVTSGE